MSIRLEIATIGMACLLVSVLAAPAAAKGTANDYDGDRSLQFADC